MSLAFGKLRDSGFNVSFTYHADAILRQDFPEAAEELQGVIDGVSISIGELVRGGGGEAQVTQRLRRALQERGWGRKIFDVQKIINKKTTFSQSHEVDHTKAFTKGVVALEIEWNNKDPFFDRDLENFNRLHGDGGISVGVIVTRGDSFQDGIKDLIGNFAVSRGVKSFDDLEPFGATPTQRQRKAVDRHIQRHACSFAEAWASCFTSDKFSSATTHWAKLEQRLDRGVGSPCPIVGIGIPLSRVTEFD